MAGHVKFSLFMLAMVVSGSAFGAIQPTVYEPFNSQNEGPTAWISNGSHSSPGANDYGFSATDNTGTAVNAPGHPASGAGEVGGFMQRGNFSDYAFNVGVMSKDDVLHADGVYRALVGNGNIRFGFYNEASHITAGGDCRNFMGFQMDDGFKIFEHRSRSDHDDRYHQGPIAIPLNTTVQWSIDYSNATGDLVFNMTGLPSPVTLPNTLGYYNGGAGTLPFDRFGFFSNSVSSNIGQAFWDDITFSSTNPIPEPASLGLLSLCGLALIRRSRRAA